MPATALSLLALAGWIVLVVVVAGRPLATDDLWWHLELGEQYARHGPWLDADPMLRTPLGPPDPASWLFDVALHGIWTAAGFQGLRGMHGVLVVGCIALAAALARHERRTRAAAALATGAFLAVSWYRLVQFRPELITILVALGSHALLLARPEPPSRRRVAAFCALLALGANAHAGFLLGPILVAAGLAGVLLRAGLEHRAGALAARDASQARARRIGLALVLGLGAALANPRGIAQHLAPFTSLVEPRLPQIRDEWSAFDPFSLPAAATRMSPLAWGIADGLILGALAAGGWLAWRFFARDRALESTRRDEPVLLALAVASAAAMLLAIRLHWLAVFPALLLLRLAPAPEALSRRARTRADGACALALAALLVAAPTWGGMRPGRLGVPPDPAAYVATPYAAEKYHAQAVWFLRDAGLSGHLFGNYFLGGFLGFWLAPRIQTFVNGTLNFPPQRLLDEYEAVVRARPAASGASHLDVLRHRDVDLFLGVGLPQRRDPRLPARYTTTLLEGAPGWVPVFRNLNSSVYLRRSAAGHRNLERVAAYYAREGIAFDPELGFDPARVLRERPDWAAAQGLAPAAYPAIVLQSRAADPRLELAALERLGALYAALGLYTEGLAVEQRILSRWPRAIAARRRLLFDLLHLGRTDEVIRQAEVLERLGLRDALAEGYARTARRVSQGKPRPPLLPLFSSAEASRVLAGVPSPALRRSLSGDG